MCSHSHSHGVVLPPSLPTHCSERVSVPTHTPMVSYYHQVITHTVFSLTHSPIHVIPVNTPMVSYYHQVYTLTALRELVLPLTLPWCRTTTKSSLTPTPILVLPLTLPSTMSSHTLLPSLHFTSQMHHKCITNASPTISHTLPPIMPPSHHHHLITSSYHQPPPIASSHSTQHS